MCCDRYVKRKTKQDFRAHQHETSTQAVDKFLKEARAELEVVKRQTMVYSMYARKHKSIMVRCRLWREGASELAWCTT